MLISQIDFLAMSIIALQITALGWLAKSVIGSLWLYAKERHVLDMVIAGLFLGFTIDRVAVIAVSYTLYSTVPPSAVYPPSTIQSLYARLTSMVILNCAFLFYDLMFYKYGTGK